MMVPIVVNALSFGAQPWVLRKRSRDAVDGSLCPCPQKRTGLSFRAHRPTRRGHCNVSVRAFRVFDTFTVDGLSILYTKSKEMETAHTTVGEQRKTHTLGKNHGTPHGHVGRLNHQRRFVGITS